MANKWQGDEITTQKSEDHTRLMFHNIRNLPLYGPAGFEHFIQSQSSLQVDILAFSEHSLDSSKFQVYQAARDILRRTYAGSAVVQLDSSSEPAVNTYKPGGTGIVALGASASKLETLGRGGDSLGRWSFMSFRRKNSKPITIISAYQVCPRPTNRIGNTAYHQQERLLHQSGRHVHPRQAFIVDLQAFISNLQTKGHDIILGGDFNESLQDRNSGILNLITTIDLVDPFLHRFPQHPEFGTHDMGSRRIDLVFVSPSLLSMITAVGYPPFEYASHSDHRPLILELHTTQMFGTPGHDLYSNRRALQSKDKMAVVTFVTTLYDRLDQSKIFSLQSKLDNDEMTPQEVEELDWLLGEHSNVAEKKCRRRRPEFYSRKIVQQRFEVTILKRHLVALQKNQDRTAQLYQHMDRTGIAISLPPTQALTRKALREARERLQETCKQSFETRQAELNQRIQELSDGNQKKSQKIVKAIRSVEQHRKTFRTLKAIKKSKEGSAMLDRLEIPNSWPAPNQSIRALEVLEDPKLCTEWRSVQAPSDIEYYLMLRNRLHFGQAQGSPFTVDPLQREIDWLATSPAAEELLQGEYDCSHASPHLRSLLESCRALAPLDTIEHELSMDDFRSKILSWRESTTTSPSGRHLGRYKALFVHIPMEESEDVSEVRLSLEDKQALIAKAVLGIVNYCIRNTYVLDRWKTVVNVMILKEPSNYRIHRLRVIHIYEADYNAMCAIKWRKLLRFADNQGLLHEGQYGGRPGCQAQSLTLLEELKYDMSYLTRRTLLNFDNDASSCYDRIVVPLASLINRKYGLHRQIVATHASTLKHAKFRLKTQQPMVCPILLTLIAPNTPSMAQVKGVATPQVSGCSYPRHCLTYIPRNLTEPSLHHQMAK